MKAALSALLLILAFPLAAQETFVHAIPPGCISVTVPASPTTAGSVTITCPPLHITTPVILPKGVQGTPYNADLAILANPTGGVAPYTFTLNQTPTPPSWLKLGPKGKVSGTPNATGVVNFTFTVTDSSGKLTMKTGSGNLNVKGRPPQVAVDYHVSWRSNAQ